MSINSKAVIAEIRKRNAKNEELASRPKFIFEDFCFDKQVEFFRPKNTTRFRTAVCSRRAGKTVGIAADAISTCLDNDGVNVLYITITQQLARTIIWEDLKKIIDEFKLDCTIDNTRLTISFSNRSKIYIAGAKDRNEIEKFRGWKNKRIYIDECQSFRSYIKELIDDVLIPTLRDERGDLLLTGTPGPIKAGIFYEYSHSDFWDNYHWTAFDNPHMHNPPNKDLNLTLEEERLIKGIDEQNASYIRETFGQWVEDLDSLVFKFNKSINTYDALPKDGNWTYIFGIDIGYNDSDAIAVLGYNDIHKKVYLVDEFVKNKQNISELIEVIHTLKEQYKPVKMVMDAGALGKKIQEEIRFRYGLNLDAAEKHRKGEFIELLNDDLRTGKFQAFSKSIFEEDCYLVQWDQESIARNPEKPRISDAYHSDITDAVLYAWRECRHYLSESPFKSPELGSDAYMQELEQKEARELERQLNEPNLFGIDIDFNSDEIDNW